MRCFFAASLAVLAIACGPAAPQLDASACPAGTARACTCPDMSQGQQDCGADGRWAGVCTCPPVVPVPTCTGPSWPCSCGGGLLGTAPCTGGVVGACTCPAEPVCDGNLRTSKSISTSVGAVSYEGGSASYNVGRSVFDGVACVASVSVSIVDAKGYCRLTLDFGASSGTAFGGLRGATLELTGCAQVPIATQRTWATTQGLYLPAWPVGLPSPGFEQSACQQVTALQFPLPSLLLSSTASSTITLDLRSLVLSGSLWSDFRPVTSCVQASCGGSYHDGGDGWCARAPDCATGFHDGGHGTCLASGCAAGYHDGGAGACIAVGTCAYGYYDGGDGACRQYGLCSPGYHQGGNGTCLAVGTCSSGYHDAGDGSCVYGTSCVWGYHDDGAGKCVQQGCAVSFHDGGAGACVPLGQCSSWYHDGGAGLGVCLPLSSCSAGYHNDGAGTCVGSGCAAGFHDGGAGVCVAATTCSSTFHDGGDGTCVSNGTCANGYHSGGTGTCLPAGQCSPSYHDGGAGVCVWQSTCSVTFHDDGAGVCVQVGCAMGFHDGGAGVGICIAQGTCSSGYHDGGDGSCVSLGSCVTGWHDDGLGACVLSGCAADLPFVDGACSAFKVSASLPASFSGHVAVPLADGRVILAGGATRASVLVDPVAGTATATGDVGLARTGATGVRLATERVLLIGGATSGYGTSSVEQYDPAKGVWQNAAPLAYARYGHAAVLLPGGKVLVAGGRTSGSTYPLRAELYDPVKAVWTAAGDLNAAKSSASAVLLGDGRVLLAGTGTACEIFDPVGSVWSRAAPLNVSRGIPPTLLALGDGRVLAVGGGPAEIEAYDPAIGTWSTVGKLKRLPVSGAPVGAALLPSGRLVVVSLDSALAPASEVFDLSTGEPRPAGNLRSPHLGGAVTSLQGGGVLVTGGIVTELYTGPW